MDKPKPTQQEKHLYPAVQQLMESRGYTVIPQFKTFSLLTDSRRILDLLGFRWTEDGDLDAWAVEAKPGSRPADTLAALGQAIEYQLYVPRVSVAAEVSRDNLEFAEYPLRQLGLGYIYSTAKSATEIIAPTLSPRCYQSEFNQVIRHAGVLCLIGRKRWPESNRREHHSSGWKTQEAKGFPSFAIHDKDPIQLSLSLERSVKIEIWVEQKPVLQEVYRRIDAGRFAALLRQSRTAANIFIHKRDNFGSLGKPQEKRELPLDEATMVKEIDYARGRLSEKRVIPVISVFLDLWHETTMPRRAEAEQAVAQALERLKPIRAYLAAVHKKSG